MGNFVVIGGSSGIGKAMVEQLESEGHNVFATYYKNEVAARENIHYQQLNVLDDELTLHELPESIDGLAYCPGSIQLKPFKRFSPSDFLDDYQLQLIGATKVIQLLLPKLSGADTASIVLFSTIAVQNGFNFHSQVAASKGAVEGLTRALAAELAPKIRVNAVAPSLTNTPLAEKFLNTPEKKAAQGANNPLKRVGEASDIAEAATYLLTSRSSWMTGQILHVDGGYSTIKS